VLKNIMGLWLLQRVLKEQNVSDLQGLIARTAALPACRFIIDCNDDRFINPASMSAEIQAACRDPGSRFLKRRRTGALHFRQPGAALRPGA
jgi:rhamnulokinase